MVWHLVTAFVVLLAILFLWRVLRIRIAVWLLLPWLCWSFAYLVLPRIEPEPQSPIPATAIVDSIATITTLGDMSGNRSIALQHPYEIVRLKFLPSGMDTAVTAIDKVDVGSMTNLKEGQTVNIAYEAVHPRIAGMQQGTRFFPVT